MKWNSMVLAILLATLIMQPVGAIAQEKQEKKKKEEKPFVLPPVTVTAPVVPDRATTATKTDTPLKDIPASIQVVPKEVLENQRAYRLDEALRNVSGLTRNRETGGDRLQIRGLDVQFLRNGLPDGSPREGFSRTLTDVERIEVLKGPASALYGSGFPGGAVNLVTKQPLEKPLYSLQQIVGSFGTYRTTVDLGGPLGSKKLLYRFNAAFNTIDGFRDVEKENIEILPTITWRPNQRHTLTLDFDYRKIEEVRDSAGIPFRGSSIVDVPLKTKFFTPFIESDREIFRGAINYELRLTDALLVQNNFSVLRLERDSTRNRAGLVKEGSIKMTDRRLRLQTTDKTDILYQIQPVWKVQTGAIKHTLLGGFEYQYRTFHAVRDESKKKDKDLDIADVFNPVIPETSLADFEFSQIFDRKGQANQFGLYLQDQIEFTEWLKSRVGVRYERFDNQFDQKGSERLTQVDDKVFGNAGLVYQPIPSTSFYGAFSRGVISNFNTFSRAFPLETSEQWEVGNKSTFLDGRISVNLTLFHLERKNVVTRDKNDELVVGAGEETKGIEIDLVSEPIPGWQFSANYAFHDVEQKNPTNPDRNGKLPRGIPRSSGAFWTTYEIQSGPFVGLGFGGGLTYKGKAFADREEVQKVPSWIIGDLVFFYRQGRVKAQVNVNNFTDKDYFRSPGFRSANPGQPLTVLGTVQIHF